MLRARSAPLDRRLPVIKLGDVAVVGWAEQADVVLAKRLVSSLSSFSATARWMMAAMSPSGTSERMRAASRSSWSCSSALAVNWTL
jgi:hypothetical protein